MPSQVRGISPNRMTNSNQSSCGAGLMPLGAPGISRTSGTKKTKTTCDPIMKFCCAGRVGPVKVRR